MHILQIHNKYQQLGGEDDCVDAIGKLLVSKGHQVTEYLRHNGEIRKFNHWQMVKLGASTVWSREASRSLEPLLDGTKFDLAHIHNTFPLISPAIIRTLARRGVPVVQHIHNFRLGCANAVLFRDDSPCDLCWQKHSGLPAVVHACYQNSRAKTLAVVAMQQLHKTLGTYSHHVSRFIAPTAFVKQRIATLGINADLIDVIPNFLHESAVAPPALAPTPAQHKHFLYFGRLAPEKGIVELVSLWRQHPNLPPLMVAGEGPERAKLVELIGEDRERIQLLGLVREAEAINKLFASAIATIVPSKWPEVFGRSVIDAFSRSVPVIVSSQGGLPELVADQETGFIADIKDSATVLAAVNKLSSDVSLRDAMGQRCFRIFQERYTADRVYTQLLASYQAAGAVG